MSDIETAKPRDRLVDQSADVIVLADVGVDELGLRTESAQFLNERLAGLVTPTGNDDLRALPGKGDGGGAAYACEASRDQNDWLVHCATPDERVMPHNFSNNRALSIDYPASMAAQ
jgi:hypothetical protein